MVKYNYIIRSIDDYIKCKATAHAKQVGGTAQWEKMKLEGGKWETIGLSPNDEEYYKVSYDNGAEIYFNIDGDVTHLNYPDLEFDENYLGEDSYDFFSDQKQKMIDNFNKGQNLDIVGEDWGEERYKYFVDYCDNFASWRGWDLNKYLRGIRDSRGVWDLNRLKSELGSSMEDMWGHDGGLHDDFCDVVANNDLSGYDDFFTVRRFDRLHDNDSLEKKIVWDKGHTCASVGMVNSDFGNFVDDVDDAWTVFTIHKKGNKASKGAFMGSALNEARGGDWRGDEPDWEKELHYAPNQKFERLIIDEKSKIIFQIPYEA